MIRYKLLSKRIFLGHYRFIVIDCIIVPYITTEILAKRFIKIECHIKYINVKENIHKYYRHVYLKHGRYIIETT